MQIIERSGNRRGAFIHYPGAQRLSGTEGNCAATRDSRLGLVHDPTINSPAGTPTHCG